MLKKLLKRALGLGMELVVKDFTAEFKPVHLSIPTCEKQHVEWEIAFDTVHNLNHIVTVGMLGYDPQYVQVDG